MKRQGKTEFLAMDPLLDRLMEETERSRRSRRGLAMLVIDVGDRAAPGIHDSVARLLQEGKRKIDVLGRISDSEWGLILTETNQAHIPAQRLLGAVAVVVPAARAGFARCPADASEAAPLLAGARQAARRAPPGTVVSVPETATRIRIDSLTLIIADRAMKGLMELVERLAPTRLPVLITGETGVGKEVIAQTLHQWSDRRTGPLVTINCAAIAPSLFESELFGHAKGAFTGATEAKRGLLEAAEGGTVLLDEIGECPLETQAKLLRALDTHRICRVGTVQEIPVDIRILAATNRDLGAEVRAGRFRRDLYYRLNAALVTVPALRHRPLDIPPMVQLLLEEACAAQGRSPLSITPEAMRRLTLHDWPGNVRELRNLMEFSAATIRETALDSDGLPPQIAGSTAPWLGAESQGARPQGQDAEAPQPSPRFRNLREEIEELERTRMLQALDAAGGVQNKAAALIGMPLRTFASRLRKYGISTRLEAGNPRGDP